LNFSKALIVGYRPIKPFGLDRLVNVGVRRLLKIPVPTFPESCFKNILNRQKLLEMNVPAKKTTKLPTVKEKLASLATKKPKARALAAKSNTKNGSETNKTEPTAAAPFDWYGSAKNRLSVAQKRDNPNNFSTEHFARIIPNKDQIID